MCFQEWQSGNKNHMFKAFFTYKIKGARYKIYGSKDSQLSPAWVKPASTVEAGNVWQEQSAYYRLGGGWGGAQNCYNFFFIMARLVEHLAAREWLPLTWRMALPMTKTLMQRG